MQVAEEFNLKVVEDAAPAIGASWEVRNLVLLAILQDLASKEQLLVTGEGGMLVTNNTDYYNKAKKYGIKEGIMSVEDSLIDEKGLKYKMSNIQAAIGLGHLEELIL